MKNTVILITTMAFLLMLAMACESEEGNGEPDEVDNGEAELSEWEMDHGIGPVDEPVEIGALDTDKASRGRITYRNNCSSCHRMETRLTGPPLLPALDTRTPEFVMNFIINPGDNIDRHPIGQSLMQTYLTRMPDLRISEEEAREIYEYLRYYDEHGENPPAD